MEKNEIWALITKLSTWAMSILIGVMAKVSHDLLLKKKRSTWQWIGVVGLSIFFGYIASVICLHKNMEDEAHWIVPMTTLFGEKLILYVSANWSRLLNLIIEFIKPK